MNAHTVLDVVLFDNNVITTTKCSSFLTVEDNLFDLFGLATEDIAIGNRTQVFKIRSKSVLRKFDDREQTTVTMTVTK